VFGFRILRSGLKTDCDKSSKECCAADHAGQTNVPPDLDDVIAFSASDTHNLVLRSNGTIVAWGDNASDECDVPGWLTNIISVAAGSGPQCGAPERRDYSRLGERGTGTVGFPHEETNLVAISAGRNHIFSPAGLISAP
jgi:hypothetical protein